MRTLLMTLLVVGLSASSALAGVDVPPTKSEADVRFAGLNAACPGFTTPEAVPQPTPFADLWERMRVWQVVKDGFADGTPIGIKTTTIRGHATDGAGVRFKVDATFTDTTTTFVEGMGWVFTSPLVHGVGPIEITRKDGAAIVGEATFAFDRGGGGDTVALTGGSCLG